MRKNTNHRRPKTPRQIAVDGLTLVLATVLSVVVIAVVSWLGSAEAASRIVSAFQ